MGKGGGAGKVYFVLYLAVVLELLIIIVERDEAEEGLLKKQRESMKIVESILSQLQSGAGTEGINTRPQDEITLLDPGINVKELLGGADIKSFRRYSVEVGVTDISAELKKKEGESAKDYAERLEKSLSLGNVEEIEYQIFYNSSSDAANAPLFPSDEDLRKNGVDFLKFQPGQSIQASDNTSWEFLSLKKLVLDKRKVFDAIDLNNVTMSSITPVYPKETEIQIGPALAPKDKGDSVFFYSIDETQKQQQISGNASSLLKRSFMVYFEPNRKAGWYKLRFASRTNRILGVKADVNPRQISDETNINIGTVSLTVKDLRKVLKELTGKLEKYNPPTFEVLAVEQNTEKFETMLRSSVEKATLENADNVAETISKLRLYGYIVRLLAPGQSANFAQNKGSIEFNVRVILPTIKSAKPTVKLPSYTPTFDKLPGVIEMTITPFMETNILEGKVVDAVTNTTVARINFKAVDEINGTPKPTNGTARDYRGTVETALSPGKYNIVVNHRLGAENKEETSVLEVFPTKLTDPSDRIINARMEILYYGDNFILINPEPASGGKIRPEQFRIYISTDKSNSQNAPINGLSVTKDNAIFLDCGVKTASLRITWVQPYTGTEVDLFPLTTKNVRQKSPIINTGEIGVTSDEIAQNRVKVTIRNVKLSRPLDGKDGTNQANVVVDCDKKVTFTGMQGVDLFAEPTIIQDGDGYKIEFSLNINLPRGVDMVNGTASVRVIARAKNTCNPEIQSTQESKVVNASIKYEPKTPGRGGRGGTGGNGGGGSRAGRK